MYRFSISESISISQAFLAFFCFLVVGIEKSPNQTMNYLTQKGNSETVFEGIFTSRIKSELCPTQAMHRFLYP